MGNEDNGNKNIGRKALLLALVALSFYVAFIVVTGLSN